MGHSRHVVLHEKASALHLKADIVGVISMSAKCQ
jgi:hypothetical protein